MNGCHTDAPEVVAEYATFQFRRCPVTVIAPRATAVLMMARERYMEGLTGRERLLLPAKRIEALAYADYLLETRKLMGVDDADRD